MRSRRPFLVAGMVLLCVSAFGGLAAGIPLVIEILTDPVITDPGPGTLLVSGLVVGYGLLSLVGAVALLRGWRRATALVLVPQGVVAIGLLWLYVWVVADGSLLAVAGIAGGAAISVVADRRLAARTERHRISRRRPPSAPVSPEAS